MIAKPCPKCGNEDKDSFEIHIFPPLAISGFFSIKCLKCGYGISGGLFIPSGIPSKEALKEYIVKYITEIWNEVPRDEH